MATHSDSGGNLKLKITTRVPGLIFSPRPPTSLKFSDDSPFPFEVGLSSDDSKKGLYSHRDLDAYVRRTVEATEEESAFVEGLETGVYRPCGESAMTLPHVVRGQVCIDTEGRFHEGYRLPLKYYPARLKALCETAYDQLPEILDRFLRLLRWRQGAYTGAVLFERPTLYWGAGRKLRFVPIGPRVRPSGLGKGRITWGEDEEADMRALWRNQKAIEPLAYELLQESAQLAHPSPRSSILTAAAALEIGVKSYCSAIAPDTTWIFEKLPSPPIDKILREFVPEISKKAGTDVAFWSHFKPQLKAVQKFIEVRNKIAHTGVVPPDALSAKAYISLVGDFLQALDVLSGHEWSGTYVKYHVRDAAGWPNPKHPEVHVEFEVLEE